MPAVSEILAALSSEDLAPAELGDPQTELGRRVRAALDPGEQQAAPWFLRLFIAAGTWIGAIIIGLFLVESHLLSSAPPAAILGGLLLAGAAAVAWKLPETVLTTQITWIFAIAGQIAILIAVDHATHEAAAVSLAAVLLQLLVIPAIPYRLFRLVSAIALVVALTIWIMIEKLPAGVDLLVIAVAGAVVALWLADVRLAAARRGAVWRPVAFGLSAGLLMPLVILALLTQAGFAAEVALFSMPVLVSAGLGLLGLWVARTAFAEKRRTWLSAPGVAVVAGVILLVLVGRLVPGLIAGLLLLMLAELRKERGLEVLALVYIAVFLSFFYYNLETPLLWKSLWVIATGAVLLALAAAVRRWLGEERETRRRSFRPGDAELRHLVAALALALLLPIWFVIQKEQVLAAGQTVLLELRPLDPRSLIQGDYMRLAYALEDEIREAGGIAQLPRNGKLVVRLDAEGVAHYIGVWDGRDLGSGEQLLRYRVRSTSWRERLRLGAESFFFEEGTAEVYQEAEYGELRVDRHGEAVLVGLRDAERRPLGRRLH